ncbi:hypothetical protein [Streptomyces mirabilis]
MRVMAAAGPVRRRSAGRRARQPTPKKRRDVCLEDQGETANSPASPGAESVAGERVPADPTGQALDLGVRRLAPVREQGRAQA